MPVIVVFADGHDQVARRLVEQWEDRGASLMTPGDLSRPGWNCNSRRPMESTFVSGGHVRAAKEIDGILVRVSTILESQLATITTSNRGYVASEMTAFMMYWLSVLDRPVLNRPTPRSLSGPGWYPEHWVRCASSVGLRTPRVTRSVTSAGFDEPGWGHHAEPVVELTIVGERCFGNTEPGLVDKARRLARASGVDLVCFQFDGIAAESRFLAADLFPDLDDESIQRAVLHYLTTQDVTRRSTA